MMEKRESIRPKVLFWLPDCRYEVVINSARKINWKIVKDEKLETKANVFWVDTSTINERLSFVQPWQIVNHFPGMPNISRKNRMGQNLNKLQKIFPKEYTFYPRTWVLPAELSEFRNQFDEQGNAPSGKVFIIKPDAGCQGRGIFLTTNFKSIPAQEPVVAQTYIKKPLLLNGYKFDLRIYLLVTSVKPLRMYLFRDGLVRMCTEEYARPTKENLSHSCMHLTNYAVNKLNENFHQPTGIDTSETDDYDERENNGSDRNEMPQEVSSKRSLAWFLTYITSKHGKNRTNLMWKKIGTMCTRTILSILPTLGREYDLNYHSFQGIPLSTSSQSKKMDLFPINPTDSCVDQEQTSNLSSNSVNPNLKNETEMSSHTEINENENVLPFSNAGTQSSPEFSKPQFRGSRCFEVLGLDIMIDSTLKPWLIEVNHLPSFGTDSPLDEDVKSRLLSQVLSVVAANPDDEIAYQRHHKDEAIRRLNARKQQPQENDKGRRASFRRRPSTCPTEDEKVDYSNSENINSDNDHGNDNNVARESNDSSIYIKLHEITTVESIKVNEESNQDDKNSNVINKLNNQIAELQNSSNSLHKSKSIEAFQKITNQTNFVTDDSNTSIEHSKYPVASDRLEKIKMELHEIYAICSPDKIPKIDKLLEKYVGREEEFLDFVHMKYSIPKVPDVKHEDVCRLLETNSNQNTSQMKQEVITSPEVNKKLHSRTSNKVAKPLIHPPFKGAGTATDTKHSRLLSPDGRNRNNQRDEDFRKEILETYLSHESADPWLLFETKSLTEFDRLFPPVIDSRNSCELEISTSNQEEVIGQVVHNTDSTIEMNPLRDNNSNNNNNNNNNNNEDSDDDDRNNSNEDSNEDSNDEDDDKIDNADDSMKSLFGHEQKSQSKSRSGGKSASFEEILCKVFELDRRLTQRLPRGPRSRSESAEHERSFSPEKKSIQKSQKNLSQSIQSDNDMLIPLNPKKKACNQAEAMKKLCQGDSVLQNQSIQTRVRSNSSKQKIPSERRHMVDNLIPLAVASGSIILPFQQLSIPKNTTGWSGNTIGSGRSRVLTATGAYIIDDSTNKRGHGIGSLRLQSTDPLKLQGAGFISYPERWRRNKDSNYDNSNDDEDESSSSQSTVIEQTILRERHKYHSTKDDKLDTKTLSGGSLKQQIFDFKSNIRYKKISSMNGFA